MPFAKQPVRKLDYEDYCRIPDDGLRHEILDGVEHVSPAPGFRHQDVVSELTTQLRTWSKRTGAGKVLVAPFDVRLGDHDIAQPDVLWIASEHLDRLNSANLVGAPDLAVEVLSPGSHRRDLVVKRERYALAGVAEYWVVDPEAGRVEVFRSRREGDGPPVLEKALELWAHRGDRLESPLLPRFAAEVKELLA